MPPCGEPARLSLDLRYAGMRWRPACASPCDRLDLGQPSRPGGGERNPNTLKEAYVQRSWLRDLA